MPLAAKPMPMLALIDSRLSSTSNGGLSASTMWVATGSTWLNSLSSHTRIANSSPERRATISGAHRRAQALGEFDQHRVAGRMAEVVVDRLEMVDVETQHRSAEALLARFQKRLLESLEEQRSVWQPGQNVVFGPASKLRLDGLALRDVACRDRDSIAELDRLMRNPTRREAGSAELFRQRLAGRDNSAIALDEECRVLLRENFLQRLADHLL